MNQPDAPLKIFEIAEPRDMAEAFRIRREVFVTEQNVPEDEEIDGLDPVCRHYLVREGAHPGPAVATARLKSVEGAVKIQRVAVVKRCRGSGVGAALMRAMIADIREGDPAARIALDAQIAALRFYENLGFAAEGPEFLDAGIPHRRMTLS